MLSPEWIGAAAGFLTTSAYLPQVIKTCFTRDTSGLSLGMYIAITGGLILWTVYGIMMGSISIIVANGVAFLLAAWVLIMKLRFG